MAKRVRKELQVVLVRLASVENKETVEKSETLEQLESLGLKAGEEGGEGEVLEERKYATSFTPDIFLVVRS